MYVYKVCLFVLFPLINITLFLPWKSYRIVDMGHDELKSKMGSVFVSFQGIYKNAKYARVNHQGHTWQILFCCFTEFLLSG